MTRLDRSASVMPRRAAMARLRTGLRWLNLSPWARAQRDAMLWLLPYLMLWSVLMLLQELLRLTQAPAPLTALAGQAVQALRELLPLVIWGAIGAMAALRFGLVRTPVAYVCVAAGVVTQLALGAVVGPLATASASLVAMAAPYPLVALLSRLAERPGLQLVHAPSPAGRNVRDALNLVLPAMLSIALVALGTAGLFKLLQALAAQLGPADALLLPPLAIGWLYSLGNSVAWFFGIHGYYLLLPLLESLPDLAQQPGLPISRTFLGVYVFIGGSGSTLSLVLALLIQRRKRDLRVIGLAGALPALLNVNELLLFGLPIILNPYFLLPFVLVPACNLLVSLGVAQLGWIAPLGSSVPFNSPVVLNALLATHGDPRAVLLQALNVALGVLIYWPFVTRWIEAGHASAAPPALRSIDTEYSRRAEEASFRLDDPVRQLNETSAEAARVASRIQALGELDFVLHYQPKVCPFTRRPLGAEALLRLVDADGKTVPPGDFLPDLSAAGLLKELDLWVVTAAVEQVQRWREAGHTVLPVAVNLSADSLMDLKWVRRLAAQLARAPGLIDVELTEGALLADQLIVSQSLEALREAGARLEIDDFGTGYSSLSYLHRFRVDGIKIDRSFTLALTHARGREVFQELCVLARRLDLHLTVEGIEEAWQLDLLPRDRPIAAQGFLFSRALPAEDYVAFQADAACA